jgi:hypothetical protein
MSTKVKDPPVRRNGRCAVCNKERPPIAKQCGDPFCSAKCCREWHKVES